MANNVYAATALTGGAEQALDALDGSILANGDIAFVTTSLAVYCYTLDADSAVAESSPDVIAPDTNAGDKRWILVNVQSAAVKISSDGEMNNPSQPAFMAYVTSTVGNVTGDNTVYALADIFTEVFDQGGNFAAGVFTAPVSGRYAFNASVMLTGITSDHGRFDIRINTSNKAFYASIEEADDNDTGGIIARNVSIIADLDANDTCYISIAIIGTSKVVDVYQDHTFFSGALIC